MKIRGSQVSMKLVMRLHRLGPGVFVTRVETFGLAGWAVLFATGLIPPFAGALLAQVLAFGAHFWAGAAALAAETGARRARESSTPAAARARVLAGGCETTAVIQGSHRHSPGRALP